MFLEFEALLGCHICPYFKTLFSVCVCVYVMNLFLLLRIWALGLTQPENLAQDVRIVEPLYEILRPYLQHSM
jgi:hypothetical protein